MMEPAYKYDNKRFTRDDLEFTRIGLEGCIENATVLCRNVCGLCNTYHKECEDCPINESFHGINNQLMHVKEMLDWYDSNEHTTENEM